MGQSVQAVLVEELPYWEWTGTHFIAEWAESGIRRAYTPNDFFQLFASMAKVSKEYRLTSAEIIPFPVSGEHHAASS